MDAWILGKSLPKISTTNRRPPITQKILGIVFMILPVFLSLLFIVFLDYTRKMFCLFYSVDVFFTWFNAQIEILTTFPRDTPLLVVKDPIFVYSFSHPKRSIVS